MHGDDISYAYGFWSLVIVNVALFAFFIFCGKSCKDRFEKDTGEYLGKGG